MSAVVRTEKMGNYCKTPYLWKHYTGMFHVNKVLCAIFARDYKVIIKDPVTFTFALVNGIEISVDATEYRDGRKYKNRAY